MVMENKSSTKRPTGIFSQSVLPVWVDRRAEFKLGDRDFVVIQLNTGKVEIYWVDPSDGIEMFQGYADERRVPAPYPIANSLVVAALGALAAGV
jgi:hypothetical protein